MKLQTAVEIAPAPFRISLDEGVLMLGSCFTDNISEKMAEGGMNVCANPSGPLYNPASVLACAERLVSGRAFSEEECVELGAGSQLVCTFSHHTKAARATATEFLHDANAALGDASAFASTATTVAVTLGTAYVFSLVSTGEVVTNCLKHPAREFERRLLDIDECASCLERLVALWPVKRFIFTVSPIRHMADGAHGNQISKATLLLAVSRVVSAHPDRCFYFPSYEIVLDELRDYRFYAEDMVHPSPVAVSYIWERFQQWCLSPADISSLESNARTARRSRHIPLH